MLFVLFWLAINDSSHSQQPAGAKVPPIKRNQTRYTSVRMYMDIRAYELVCRPTAAQNTHSTTAAVHVRARSIRILINKKKIIIAYSKDAHPGRDEINPLLIQPQQQIQHTTQQHLLTIRRYVERNC